MRVRFTVPAEVAFDYLVDPHHRPEWQSSLARVEQVVGGVTVGQRWLDVTKPGVRARMETTELERPRRWTERGTWRSFSAWLTLTFEPAADGSGGCDVGVEMALSAAGRAAPVARVLGVLSPFAVRSDLRRAARLLAERHSRP